MPRMLERLEERTLLAVSILNGGGLGYAGNGGGGPPDVTGAAGPNSYLQIDNSTVTLFSKAGGTILDQHGINDFFYNAAIGNETRIYSQTVNIAASPTGATEAGTTVTITTTTPHGFVVGQSVSISGVGVAGYNGGFKITGTPTTTSFTYTAGTSGLAASGGGTVSGSSCGTCDSTGVFDNLMGTGGRFIIGDIDIEASQNVSQYIFAVSKSNDPTTFDATQWNFYHITTTEGSGGPSSTSWSDYPGNPGFNADAFVETFNMFGGGPTGTQVVSVKASDLAAGNPLVTSGAGQNVFRNDVPGGVQNYRPTTMHDSVAGDPMWLIHDPGTGTSIDVVKMTGVLSSASAFTTTSLALPAQDNFVASGGIGNPLNPDGSGMFDPGSRILKAGEYNKIVVAAQTVAVAAGPNTLASAQANDKNGNPTGGSGYSVGDTLTVNGGTFTTAAQLTVQTLGPNGSVATVAIANAGSYTSLAGITGVSGGTGTGASLSLFFTGELVAQWYAIDVSSGTPAFQTVGGGENLGRIGFGANTYSVEPAIDINAQGQIGLGFMESDTVGGAGNTATKGFISTFVTARQPTDAAGTMQPVVLVPAGTGSGDINGRIGDFSGMNVDPVNGTFWHTNEFGGGGPTDIANFTPNIAPTVVPPGPQAAVEGVSQSFSLGSFADVDGGPWTVDVSWGDGTPDTVFNAAAPGTITPQTHIYAEEGFHAGTITVTDTADGQFDSKLFSVIVADANLTAGAPIALVANSGVSLPPATVVGTFTDANPGAPNADGDFSATIDWGDGSPAITGIVVATGAGAFSVEGGHSYAKPGAYTTKISVQDDGGETTLLTGSATITDLGVTGSTRNFTTIEGQATGTFVLATFEDPNTLATVADVKAQLAVGGWGDGSPLVAGIQLAVQQIGVDPANSEPVFEVLGSNTYAEETPPGLPDTLSVIITTLGGTTTALTSPPGGGVTVLDAKLTSSNGAGINGIEGNTTGAVLLGTFSDANQGATVADFTTPSGSVVVNWGDGSAPETLPAADIVAQGSPDGVIFAVSAAHIYAEAGTYAYTVTATESGGSVTIFGGSGIIADAVLTPSPAQPIVNVVEAALFPVSVFSPPLFHGNVASYTDANPNSTLADFAAQIDWGDGTPLTAGTISQPGGVGTAYIVAGSHTYAESNVDSGAGHPIGLFPIQVFVTNDDGARLTVVSTATVADNPIVLTGILNPTSDSGLSTGTPNVTDVNQPDFLGKSEAFSHVSLFATPLAGGAPIPIGQVQAGSDGAWNIQSGVALLDGHYAITATAVDQFGVTHTAAPVVITTDLLIDTKGPVIDGMYFNRLNGQVDYIIKDPGATPSGVWLPSILDAANYQLTKVHANKAYPGKWIVTNVAAAPDPTIANAFDVAVTFNSGAILKGGFYLFTIRDSSSGNSSVQDLAENHLDGEFYGSFSSGNGINGGDFVAELQGYHNKIFAPQTIVGTAFAGDGGIGGPPVAAVHSGIHVPAVPRGGSPIFSTTTSATNGGDPPAVIKGRTHTHLVVPGRQRSPLLSTRSRLVQQNATVVSRTHPRGPALSARFSRATKPNAALAARLSGRTPDQPFGGG